MGKRGSRLIEIERRREEKRYDIVTEICGTGGAKKRTRLKNEFAIGWKRI